MLLLRQVYMTLPLVVTLLLALAPSVYPKCTSSPLPCFALQVYMTLSEQRNFVRNLASQLGLPADSATAAVSQALTTTMHQLSQSAVASTQPQQPAQPTQQQQQREAAEAVAALQQAVGQEWLGAIARLTELFNVRSAAQVSDGRSFSKNCITCAALVGGRSLAQQAKALPDKFCVV
jgi:hypothetical protein